MRHVVLLCFLSVWFTEVSTKARFQMSYIRPKRQDYRYTGSENNGLDPNMGVNGDHNDRNDAQAQANADESMIADDNPNANAGYNGAPGTQYEGEMSSGHSLRGTRVFSRLACITSFALVINRLMYVCFL